MREIGDTHANNVEDVSGYVKSGVRLSCLSWEDLSSVLLHIRSGHVVAASGLGN